MFGQNTPLTVCQLLTSAKDRQEVVVRGEIGGGPEHGYLLMEGPNPDPCPGWPSRFFTAPSAVIIDLFINGESLGGVSVSSQQQRLNLDFLKRIAAASRQRTLNHASVTLSGVVLRRAGTIVFRRSDGEYYGNGFGQGGGILCELVVTSIRDEDVSGNKPR